MSGWIKLHRQLTEWEWYSEKTTSRLFIHLLLTVNYSPGRWQGIEIKPGSRAVSIEKLASETGLSIQEVRTSLKRLKTSGELTSDKCHYCSIISITKWDSYQDEQQANNNQITNEQQSNNNNIRREERKKERIYIYTPEFEAFWSVYPNRTNKANALKSYQASIKETDHEKIINGTIAYADYCKRANTETRFIAHASTWLNGKRWENDYASMGIGPASKGLYANASKRGLAALEASADKILSQAGGYMD